MKIIGTAICNGLMAESIRHSLENSGDFLVRPIETDQGTLAVDGLSDSPDILLLEVAYNPGFTIEEQIENIKRYRKSMPQCKILLLCDENSTPELARKVAMAKRDRMIDDFIYSSVSESYLTALLYAI